eukprot:gene11429-23905_t
MILVLSVLLSLLLSCHSGLLPDGDLPTQGLGFFETFQTDPFASGKWVKSTLPQYENQPLEIKPSTSAGEGFEDDNALELAEEMKHYAVGTKFTTPIDPKDKDLVIQYEMKFDDVISCGGAYVKLLRQSDDLDIKNLDNKTPYSIMFGPDKCGTHNKVHFIVNHQNPISKEWEEKHFKDAPPIRGDKKTHLYTLHIKNDNSFEIFIDKKSSKKGDLFNDMEPPFNPPAEIDDPTDFKPSNWVDDVQITDPDAQKPADWDESQPMMIDDINDTKPDTWLDGAPLMIADPSAAKPEDWDDEEDGEWEAPQIANPACEKSGCGVWKPAQIKNPKYVGKWKAPLIPNPAYKGEWKAAQIANPNYFIESQPSNIHPIGGLGIEIWTTNAQIRFDNIVISHNLEAAFTFAEKTFIPKQTAEAKLKDASGNGSGNSQRVSDGSWGSYVDGVTDIVKTYVRENPQTVKVVSTVLICSSMLFVMMMITNAKKASRISSSSATTTTSVTETSGTEGVAEGSTSKQNKSNTKGIETTKDEKDTVSPDSNIDNDNDDEEPKATATRKKKTPKHT